MEIFSDISRKLALPIDFVSQQYTEKLSYRIILSGTIIACLLGYFTQSLSIGVYTFVEAYLLAILIVVPSYPMYNKHKLKWLGNAARTTESL
ncbi:HBR360Cp [Eremothecium sinecaudum]|uniref:Signal peptidase complex subunit 1 n=1 Tax=Eremothecium sinecaudum TaxID=45286 RepID=A0A120K1E2_9SACH|nr:HBR360Cp [Eremothecium sinecaudum]AMD19261.1 HBR360Cp [Eremothecium sinecaudum]